MFLTSKYNKIILFSLMIVLFFLMVAQVGLAAPTAESTGLNTTAKGGFGDSITTESSTLSEKIGTIVGAALSFLGVVFFVLIIYGGYLWMFSMGNEQTTTKAKGVIIGAVIGLVIVLMAYAITTYFSTLVGT